MNAIKFAIPRSRPAIFIFSGMVAGLLAGIVARAWMRWVSTEPEFSLAGTLGIVIGFAVFGAVQATIFIARGKIRTKRLRAFVRIVGVIFSLPLFVAAGATMFPTVLTISIATWRNKLNLWLRYIFFVTGLAFWALIIKSQIINNFGFGLITMARVLLFGLIYSAIIYALKPTVSAQI